VLGAGGLWQRPVDSADGGRAIHLPFLAPQFAHDGCADGIGHRVENACHRYVFAWGVLKGSDAGKVREKDCMIKCSGVQYIRTVSDGALFWEVSLGYDCYKPLIHPLMSSPINAPDLTQRPPRSPRCRLGNLVILPRMLDKGRATAAGKQGEFHYNCPLDQHLLNFLGLDPEALIAEIKSGKGDGELLEWVMANARNKRAPWEIEHWSAYQDKRGPDSDAETIAFFAGKVGGFSKTREDVKAWFDLLDVDDHATFGGKA
jgi:hypothetical protein